MKILPIFWKYWFCFSTFKINLIKNSFYILSSQIFISLKLIWWKFFLYFGNSQIFLSLKLIYENSSYVLEILKFIWWNFFPIICKFSNSSKFKITLMKNLSILWKFSSFSIFFCLKLIWRKFLLYFGNLQIFRLLN